MLEGKDEQILQGLWYSYLYETGSSWGEMRGTRGASDKRVVKGDFVGKYVANRAVAFKSLVTMISSKEPRGCI